jgi:hypothetical protein
LSRPGLLEAAQHLLLVLGRLHVDEVDDDDPADVAQPELATDLLGRLQVVLQDGLFEMLEPTNLPVLTSITVRASVRSMTRWPPEGRKTLRSSAFFSWSSTW